MTKLMLFWFLFLLSLWTLVSAYQATVHDDQFAQMFSYKIEELITQRGESFRPTIVTTLHTFATQFATKNPRFAYIVDSVATIVTEHWTLDTNSHTPPVLSGFEVKNKVNEENSSVWMTNAYKNPNNLNRIIVDMKINPDMSLDYHQIPSLQWWDVDAQSHCYIYGASAFSGSSTTPSSLDAPRNRAYVMSYLHIPLSIETPLMLDNIFHGSFILPTLPQGTYTFMCSVVLADYSNASPLVYRSSYYYFDVNIE